MVVSLGAYGVESIAWPLALGRDGATYLMYWVDMWHSRPADVELMLYRTPLAPLVFGPLLQLGGAALAEVAMGIAYAVSVLSFAAAACAFGRLAALLTALALLLYPPYGALFHQVSSDSVFALVLALWTLFVVRTIVSPRLWKFALHGLAVLALVLARPSSQAFLLFVLLPLLLKMSWRRRAAASALFLASAAALLLAWSGYNDLRYGDFTVSRTGNAQIPLYRAFVVDRIVSPDNGPASRKLARAVVRDLLRTQPYRSYGITPRQFFSSGSDRMWGDLLWVSDHVWGWRSDYSILRSVGIEAVRKHPGVFFHSVASTLSGELSVAYRPPVPSSSARRAPASPPTTERIRGRTLVKPTEGQPIPGSHMWWLAGSPDQRVRFVWDRYGHESAVFDNAADAMHSAWLGRRVARLSSDLPNRDGSLRVASALDSLSRIFPPLWAWLAFGLASVLLRRPRGGAAAAGLAGLGFVLLVVTALGEPPVLEYVIPLAPLFMLFALVGATGGGARPVLPRVSRLPFEP